MPDPSGNLIPGDPGYKAPGTGLINATPGQTNVTPSATPSVGYTPATASPTAAASKSYTPTGTVVLDEDTVQGQLKNVIGADSKLLQQARTKVRNEAASRGMINSSMAIGAGEDAVIGQALPIATQDAATHFNARTQTAAAENTAKQFGAGAENATSLANAQLGTDVSKTNAGMINASLGDTAKAANDQMLARLDANTRLSLGQLDATTRMSLATLDAQNRELLQSNANAANMFSEVVKNIAGISVDQTLTKAAKDAAVQSQINLLNEGLRTTGGIASTVPADVAGLNLESYFQTDSGTAFTPEQQRTNLDNEITALQAKLKDVSQNGTGVPVLTGENASERRVPLWNKAIADVQTELNAAKAKRAAMGAPTP